MKKVKIDLKIKKSTPVFTNKKSSISPNVTSISKAPEISEPSAPKASKASKASKTSEKRKYSLINNNINNIVPMNNTIVQLRITMEQINFYEKNGYGDDNLLSKTSEEPVAYNDTSSNLKVLKKFEEQIQESIDKPTTRPKKSVLSFVKPKGCKTSVSDLDSIKSKSVRFTDSEIIRQRNLIIHSGIQRKVSKTMEAFADGDWPTYSPYDCWVCCHGFKTSPVGIPDLYVNDVFYLYGNFCSYNCAMHYLDPNLNTEEDRVMLQSRCDIVCDDGLSEKKQLLEMLCHLETGCDIYTKIKPSGSRLSLKKFGGPKTIEEYRDNFITHTEYHIYRTPMIPISYQMEEVTNDNIVKKPVRVPIDKSKIDHAFKELSKKREQIKNHSVISRLKTTSKANVSVPT